RPSRIAASAAWSWWTSGATPATSTAWSGPRRWRSSSASRRPTSVATTEGLRPPSWNDPSRGSFCLRYDGDMGRRALEPGEFGKMTMRGKHPKLGLWRSEASLKQERVRPKLWRAEVRYHDPEQHRVRVLTAEGDTKGAAQEALEAAMRQTKEAEGIDHDLGGTT